MNYQETLDYLYTQLPMFTRIGAAAYKKDLHNTIALCNALNNPQHQFKSIHVAGTNGKGSTSHMLAAILQQAGYKTGLYTSPHIKQFGERIRINGKMIDEDFVIEFTQRTKAISDIIEPSFFELTVAMAFEYFAKEKVDIAVIETGMGGTLDSTNVIMPVLSIITNIGFDHMDLLGNTLPEIAGQKAGIIKNNIPVVIGETLLETKPVFLNKAVECNAPVYFAEQTYVTEYFEQQNNLLHCSIKNCKTSIPKLLKLDLNGLYQAKNICTVLTAVDLLNESGFSIAEAELDDALQKVKTLTGLSGRWDIIQQQPTIILDVAHNTDGIKQVLYQLNHNYPDARFHFVMGFVNDKDVQHVLELLPANASYYFSNAHIPRALPHDELKYLAAQNGLKGDSYDDVNLAITAAKEKAEADDVIMICGSFFIIAEVD